MEYCFDRTIRKLSVKTIQNYQKQLRYRPPHLHLVGFRFPWNNCHAADGPAYHLPKITTVDKFSLEKSMREVGITSLFLSFPLFCRSGWSSLRTPTFLRWSAPSSTAPGRMRPHNDILRKTMLFRSSVLFFLCKLCYNADRIIQA